MVATNIQNISALYEEYQKFTILHQDYIDRLKEIVTAIIIEKKLTSYMNTTKWLKLQNAINELPFPPAYIARYVTHKEDNREKIKELDELDKTAPWWHGDWSNFYHEGLPPLFNIEWIKVRPQLSKFRGKLIKPEIIDQTNEFRAILNDLHIPYEETRNIFTIYGYKASK